MQFDFSLGRACVPSHLQLTIASYLSPLLRPATSSSGQPVAFFQNFWPTRWLSNNIIIFLKHLAGVRFLIVAGCIIHYISGCISSHLRCTLFYLLTGLWWFGFKYGPSTQPCLLTCWSLLASYTGLLMFFDTHTCTHIGKKILGRSGPYCDVLITYLIPFLLQFEQSGNTHSVTMHSIVTINIHTIWCPCQLVSEGFEQCWIKATCT